MCTDRCANVATYRLYMLSTSVDIPLNTDCVQCISLGKCSRSDLHARVPPVIARFIQLCLGQKNVAAKLRGEPVDSISISLVHDRQPNPSVSCELMISSQRCISLLQPCRDTLPFRPDTSTTESHDSMKWDQL